MDDLLNKLKERLKEAQDKLTDAEAHGDLPMEAYNMGRTLELTYIIKYLEMLKERTT